MGKLAIMAVMKAIFAASSGLNSDDWVAPLQNALPEVDFYTWVPEGPAIGAEIAVVWQPPADIFQREPGLRAVFNLGAGVDALLRLPGLSKNVAIVRLEDGGMAVQMAEYAIYALTRASRQFDVYQRLQSQEQWQPQPDIRRADWSVGVMGMGVMGKRVAQAIATLGYPVAGWARSGKQVPGIDNYAGRSQFEAFLKRTRVLVNTLPLTPETTGILNRQTLGLLQPGAHLINMARGEHLVEEDLLALLDSGHMHGATLDVFQQEPLPAGHAFWQHPNITVTPHIAGATLLEEAVLQVSEKVRQFLRGESVTGLVLRERGY